MITTSTTAPVEVSPTDQLPFTGANSGAYALLAMALMAAGLTAVVGATPYGEDANS